MPDGQKFSKINTKNFSKLDSEVLDDSNPLIANLSSFYLILNLIFDQYLAVGDTIKSYRTRSQSISSIRFPLGFLALAINQNVLLRSVWIL